MKQFMELYLHDSSNEINKMIEQGWSVTHITSCVDEDNVLITQVVYTVVDEE